MPTGEPRDTSNVDPAFSNYVDGMVIVDLQQLKGQRRKRYIDENAITKNPSVALRLLKKEAWQTAW